MIMTSQENKEKKIKDSHKLKKMLSVVSKRPVSDKMREQ